MTSDLLTGAGAALWLGLLTSISPCPLATNIAAVSFIGKKVGSISGVLMSGVLYTVGRMAAYAVISMIVVAGLLSIPDVAMFLQRSMNAVLGPVLLITGIILVGDFRFSSSGGGILAKMGEKAGSLGTWGASLLGILFAVSFCPVSAALFFGSLIPLSLQHGSKVLYPCIYGIGTGLPVLVFAAVLAFGAHAVGAMYRNLALFEFWARRATGIVFVIVGLYLAVKYIFHVPLPF